MTLLNSLKGAATMLGLLKVATAADPEEPTRITTRAISLHELTTELHTADMNALAAAPAEFSVPFEQVFAAAGIQPIACEAGKEGWTIDKLHDLVAAAPYKDMPREKAQPALLAALAAQKIAAEDLVKDAMARDKAIDAFAAQIFAKRQERRRAQSHKKIELQNQIAALQAQLERLDDENAIADRQWNDWWQRKLAYERQMALAVGYLLHEPIVTIDAQLPPDHNSD